MSTFDRGAKATEVYFWQQIVSPHMAGLASALGSLGFRVTYVAGTEMSDARRQQGWETPRLRSVDLRLVRGFREAIRLADAASNGSIHLCEGLRANGIVKHAQRRLAKRGLRQIALLETVNDFGWKGPLKRAMYTTLIRRWRHHLWAVFAIGHKTSGWLVERGAFSERVFPFAYFIDPLTDTTIEYSAQHSNLRLVFVGQMVPRKGLDLLLNALRKLKNPKIELTIIGTGPKEMDLRDQATSLLGSRVTWVGAIPNHEVWDHLATADYLVLPSRFDGWGAVVNEALLTGTPAICSDACGAGEIVMASGAGGVFRKESVHELAGALQLASAQPLSCAARSELSQWAKCLSGLSGARYVQRLLAYLEGQGCRPRPPWVDDHGVTDATDYYKGSTEQG